MFSGLVRTKVVAAHSKIATIVSAILLTSLFVSIPVPASANNCVLTSTTASNGETILASALQLTQVDKILGVLNNSGQTITFGSITNASWTWTPEQSLYLGDNGNIVTTSTIDGATFSLKIGYAISSTKAFIKIGTPVVL